MPGISGNRSAEVRIDRDLVILKQPLNEMEMEIRKGQSLQGYHTFGCAAKAAFYAEVRTKEEVLALLDMPEYRKMPVFWLGGGSNTLFVGDFPGLVVRLANKGWNVEKEDKERVEVRVQAGETWAGFVQTCLEQAWWGVENLSGIPGSVGGAVVQNMGAYGQEIADVVERVEVLDLTSMEFRELDQEDCHYAYRSSCFKGSKRWLVWSVILSLGKRPAPCLVYADLAACLPPHPQQKEIAEAVLRIRKGKLPEPGDMGSAGSFFTNPVVPQSRFLDLQHAYPDIPGHEVPGGVKLSAAWLIDRCGWRRYREGDAGVYEKQPLVLVNHGQASGEEIWDLAGRIRNDVRERFNVELKPEICVVDGNGCKEDQRYEEVLDVMYHCLPMFHRIGAAAYKPDLSNTERLMTALKHPYRKFKSVHVAGTNGKGSCSHMLASIFQSAGYKTGLYTSPHLRDFRERIRINGQMISKEAVVEFYEEHEDLFRKIHASFFEMTVAMAFDYFAKERVDVAIIEVGMGGRLDSTNVITPVLSLITNISWDHMQFLGDTLAKIAEEKAGIIKPGIPVVISETDPQTSLVFNRKAKECEAPVVYADARFSMKGSRMEEGKWTFNLYKDGVPCLSNVSCDLLGDEYESKNVLGCMAAVDMLRRYFTLPDNAVREGFAEAAAKTGLKGRWQCLGTNPPMYCDTGHNEAGIRLVLKQIGKMKYQRLHIVWGMVKDKDIDHILELLPRSATYYFCQAPQERALDVKALYEKACLHGLKGRPYASVPEAVAAAKAAASKEDLIYVGGSTFVVAEIC